MAYLQAIQGNVYGLTVKAADKMLNSLLNMLSAASALSKHPKLVHTVKSARHQLGLDIDHRIITHPICHICWKIYLMRKLSAMTGPNSLVLPAMDSFIVIIAINVG